MKCEDCEVLLEEFYDGELDSHQARTVETHLATCASCACMGEALQQEQAIYARYQRDIEVTPVLWAGIEARIRKEEVVPSLGIVERLRSFFASVFHAPRLSFAYTALLVVLAIGATVAIMKYVNTRETSPIIVGTPNASPSNGSPTESAATNAPANPNTPIDQPGSTPAPVPPSVIAENKAPRLQPARGTVNQSAAKPTPEQLIREAEQKYLAAIAILSRDVNRKRSELDPITVARFDNALAAVDRTIQETKKAVRQNPNDPVALQYMLSAYAKKVDVLRELAEN